VCESQSRDRSGYKKTVAGPARLIRQVGGNQVR
jgi:hypothetical protein